jgi:hypothetical protein
MTVHSRKLSEIASTDSWPRSYCNCNFSFSHGKPIQDHSCPKQLSLLVVLILLGICAAETEGWQTTTSHDFLREIVSPENAILE